MKKVIALALTLAMVLTMGVVAFAATTSVDVNDATFTIDVKEVIVITDGVADMKVSDVNGFMTFGSVLNVTGSSDYVVEATGTKLGVTEIVVTDKNGNELATSGKITIAKVPADPDPSEDRDVYDDAAAVAANGFKATIEIDITGYEGISAAVYNAATKLHPEEIVIKGEGFEVTLYRGDYKTTTLAKDIILNVAVVDKYVETVSGKVVDMNNRVLAALGNNKADPFYVTVESVNLDAVADKAEFVVDLDAAYDFAGWAKTNNSKAMAIYSFDKEDDTVAVVASNIKVNNSFDYELTMPTVASGVYVFVDATNGATSSANVKDNVSTGANDMMAVAVVFATIALAAGVSKKVR